MNILKSKAIEAFVNVADLGWKMGWHEINGGNMSYRMTNEEVGEVKDNFNFDGDWKEIGTGVAVPDFAGQGRLSSQVQHFLDKNSIGDK